MFKCLVLLITINLSQTINTKPRENQKCVCVPYYQCDNPVPTTEYSIIDINNGSNENECIYHLDICCDPTKILPSSTVPPLPSSQCGVRNTEGVGFHLNGTEFETQFGELPWMIGVFQNQKFQCAGALIHPKIVLTTAHCINSYPNLKIRAGEWDPQSIREPLQFQERNIVEVVKHPDYEKKNLINDISLLILNEPLDLYLHINTICLPEKNHIFEGNCVMSGWGKDSFERGKYQGVLKKYSKLMVNKRKCEEELRKTRLGLKFTLDDSFICTDSDTCGGDNSSPLVCPRSDGRYELAGVAAWSLGCGHPYSVFVDVAKFSEWINHHMKRLD